MGDHKLPEAWDCTVCDGWHETPSGQGCPLLRFPAPPPEPTVAALTKDRADLVALLKRHWHVSICRCDDCTDKRRLLTRLGDPGDGRR